MSRIDIVDSGVDLGGGRDVDGEIELTNRPQEISGMVVDARGEPQNASVLLFPQERDRWIFDSRLIATSRLNQAGRLVRTLPAGRYLAVAIDPSQVARHAGF